MKSSFSLHAGELFLDRYWIEKELNRGGMGVVYRAIRLEDGKNVVIKRILADKLWKDPDKIRELFTRFESEASILQHLHHPGVVQLFDYGKDDSMAPFMVMEYIWGENPAYPFEFRELDPKPTDEAKALFWEKWPRFASILDGLLEVLEMLHSQDILHRDLKPPNILVQPTYGGQLVRLIDFGISKSLIHSDKTTRPAMGSPWYIAPEQISGDLGQLSAKTDLFAVGVMLYRSLCGHYPWHHESAGPLMLKRLTSPPADPPGWAPEALVELAVAALKLDPEQRPDDARSMRQQLQLRLQQSLPMAFQSTLALPWDAVTVPHSVLAELPVAPAPSGPDGPDAEDSPKGTEVHESPFPLPTPHALKCLVVLPEGQVSGIDCDALYARFQKTVEGLVAPELWQPLQVSRISPQQLEGEGADPAHVEALEYARLVCWCLMPETSDGLSRLLHFLQPTGQVLLIRLPGQSPPLEWLHLPMLEFEQGSLFQSQLQQVLGRRWQPFAQGKQWQNAPATRGILQRLFVALQGQDEEPCAALLEELCQADPENPRFLYRRARFALQRATRRDDWRELATMLQTITQEIPEFAAAWRDLGVVYNKLGEEVQARRCFVQSTHLGPEDYDTWAAYAGFLKAQSRKLRDKADLQAHEALEGYRKSAALSHGHPYPLLNALRMQAIQARKLEWTPTQQAQLKQAIETRRRHLELGIDLPWSVFDLAEALLYDGQAPAAREVLDAHPVAPEALQRFLKGMEALYEAKVECPGLDAFLFHAFSLAPHSLTRPAIRAKPQEETPPSPWKHRATGFLWGLILAAAAFVLAKL